MINKYKFIRTLNLTADRAQQLSHLLDNVYFGSDNALRSPIANALDPDLILAGWDRIYNSKINVITDNLHKLEMSNKSKYGPRSLATPWLDRLEGVNEYFKPSKVLTFPLVSKISYPRRLRPLDLRTASNFLKNNTNSGLPFIDRKSNHKEFTVENFDYLLDRNDPCILFTRTQEGGKTRNVWGYPMVDTLNEMRYYRPLLDFQKKLNWRSALLGPEAVDESITNLIKLSRQNKSSLVSVDFSSYDASVKTQLQDLGFEYISSLFQSQYLADLDFIKLRFNTIGLITPSGILSGPHGVPSGSTFTNEVDSIVQYICAKSYGIDDLCMNIQGDDGVYSVKDPTGLFDHFRKFGLNINQEKSFVNDNDVIFLQNLHSPDYVSDEGLFAGIYPTYRALSRLIFPERFTNYSVDNIKGADFNSIRAITILENCSHHPLFRDLVEYIAKLDKYSLQYSQEGLKKYISRLSLNQVPGETFLYKRGDYIEGINRFKTVKILSEL